MATPKYKTRSKRSYQMAAKKAQLTRKRNMRSTGGAKRTTKAPAKRKTRRRPPSKKGMLSELFNPKMFEAGARATMSGAVGGGIMLGLDKLLVNQTDVTKNLVGFGISLVTATALKAPNVGSGMAGARMYKLMENAGFLAEDEQYLQEYQYSTGIEALPMVLNENGDELYLSQDQDGMYLEEDVYSYDVPYFDMGFGG